VFESRLQVAELLLFAAGLALGVAILGFATGLLAVGVFFLFVEHAVAAVGCALYAGSKGYAPLIGVPMGVALGVAGGLMILVLPDESEDDTLARQMRLAQGGVENARRRDPGYEVLDDEDD
jgi:hypothetical protein